MSNFYGRFMKAYDESDESIDYTVVSIGVQTLVLILFVESVKHKLEHAAKGRPFFGEVLHSVYSELSTLGVVELVVYLILKYYKDYNKAQKTVFADVHFCLFYVAIFNAFQTVIVALATMRRSKKQWVDTEHLELDHYVAIREEFQRVKERLGYNEDSDVAQASSIQNFFGNCIQSIKNPVLRGRYNDLLVRVNFHSLRLHLLQGNNLPLTLKVSDYLKRSEARVLRRLVHVSGGAWLMLTGGLNLIYFGMGMVAYAYEDQEVVGIFLTSIFFAMLFIFIFITVLLHFKMRSTFRTIMTTKYELKGMDEETRAEGVRKQLSLFWFGAPEFVITIIQFMQFGYALGLAIVLMYWDFLTTFDPYYYLEAVLVCYIIFVFVLSKVIPQYTLCTSLGYLVDKDHLTETVAIHRLEEARRLGLKNFVEPDKLDAGTVSVGMDSMSTDLRSSSRAADFDDILGGTLEDDAFSHDKTQILAELVKSDTASLRNLLPEDSRNSLRQRELRRASRRSTSDGVALMRALGNVIGDNTNGKNTRTTAVPVDPQKAVDDSEIMRRNRAERAANRKNRHKTVSASALIQSWHMATKLEDEEKMKASIQYSNPGAEQRRQRALRRREARHKARSESAIVRQWNAQTLADQSPRESHDIKASDIIENLDHVLAGSIPNTESQHANLNGSLNSASDTTIGALSDVEVHQTENIEDLRGDTISYEKSCFHELISIARGYFLGERYKLASDVFGSFVAFFMVGHRVEVMLSRTGAIAPSSNTWDLPLPITFWALAMWISFFVLASILILSLFLPITVKSMEDKKIITAAAMDFLLSGGCLALLFIAESQRYCDVEDEEGEEVQGCPTPFWGSRTYGGLGYIEPLTSLIALRILRFAAARYLVDRLHEHEDLFGDTGNVEQTLAKKHDGHGDGHGTQSQVGTALELWEKAITKYPDIVEKHGHFSAEVLHCMLGIEVIDDKAHTQYDGLVHQGPALSANMKSTSLLTQSASSNATNRSNAFAVNNMPKLLEQLPDLPALEEISERNLYDSRHSVKVDLGAMIDQDQEITDEVAEEHHTDFYAPTARLTRSIRRCDRKMLPILADFSSIDLAITDFEIVCFEARDFGELNAVTKKEKKALHFLRKSRGGKGVQLCDIAKIFARLGRRIVGHLKLSEVSEVHVERRIPIPESEGVMVGDGSPDILQSECWIDHQRTQQGADRNLRWHRVNEDRLRLVSEHYSLILRFYSDLDGAEMRSREATLDDEGNGELRKNIALQWAQTIAYTCGKEKLNQRLPHFGQNNTDELNDFLTVVPKHYESETSRRRKSILA